MVKQPQPVRDSLSLRQLLKRIALGGAIIISFCGILFLANAWYLIVRTHPETQKLISETESKAVAPRAPDEAAHQSQDEPSQEDLTFFKSLTDTKENEVPLPPEAASDRSIPSTASLPNQAAAAPPKTGSAAGQKKPEIASYAVQIGAFKSLAAAEKVQARLKQEGLNTSVVKATFADGSVWYRVRMAAHLPRPEAEALASRLKKDGNLNPALIPVK